MSNGEQHPVLTDFRSFLWLIWKHLTLPDPTPVQYDIANYLQHGPKRSVIEAFRGVGKSWITSAFVCWNLLVNPQTKVLVVSASKQRADDFTTFTLRLINEVEILQHLRPREDQRNSKIAFDVGPARAAHAPSVKSVGINGQIAGSRANLIIPDDIEVPNNSATQMMRDKLSESVKEFDAVLSPGGRIIYLGTPQTEQSLYNSLPARGYEVRIWPARFPTIKEVELLGPRLAPFIASQIADEKLVGKPTDPKRFNELDLMEREASYGRSGFRLQFMLDTRLSDAERYPLKLADLVIASLDRERAPVSIAWGNAQELILSDLPNVGFSGDRFYRPAWTARDPSGQPEFAEYTGSVMAIDPSGRGKDECAYAVIKILHGTLYFLESGGFAHGYAEETLEALAKIAVKQKVNRIVYESNFGDGMFGNLLKPVVTRICSEAAKKETNGKTTHSAISIEEVKHSVQKEKRIIDTLEPVMNSHRLVVAADLIKRDWESIQNLPPDEGLKFSLFYQMTRITREKGALVRDDRLDALAIAVNYWVEHMARDTAQAVKTHKQAMLDKELKRFMDHALGRKTGPPRTWLSQRKE